MARIEIGKFLVVDHRLCGGRLIFRGTRILVLDALELLESGFPPEDISRQYSGLIKPEAVREALSLTRRGLIKEVLLKNKPVVCLSPTRVKWWHPNQPRQQHLAW